MVTAMMRWLWYLLACFVVGYLVQTIALAVGLSWGMATAIGTGAMMFLIVLRASGRDDEVTK